MPHNRYYCDASFLENQSLALSGDECHHLVRVLRAKHGDRLELVNGRGQLAYAIISDVKKHSAELQIEQVFQESTAKTPLILAMGIPRMNHLEWIIEKGTELNVTSFWLFPGLLSEKQDLSESQLTRTQHLAISAMKQCGRLDLPTIEIKPPLLKWTSMQGTLLFGDTSEDAPYFWELSLSKPLPSPILWFIGPEKGLAPKERHFLLNTMKAKGVRLHRNILRTETAPLVALSLSQPLIN
jgi:16S rRNA (uracil1498-N3)-methyltransferase